MAPQVTFNDLLIKIKAYKKKYYTNKLLKGFIFFIAALSSVYLLISILEYYGRFNSSFRIVLLGGFVTLAGVAFVYWLLIPYLSLANINKQISDEEAASQIGIFFPDVKDKLLNTLQLQSISIQDNPLIRASLDQKSRELSPFQFRNAINFNDNRKYLRYTYVPLVIITLLLLFVPQLLIESTARIINYDRKYTIPAPFNFILENKELKAFQNDDYSLVVHLQGNDLPENAYINLGSRRFKMKKDSLDEFSYTFQSIQSTENFTIEAAGFFSDDYELKVIKKPALLSFFSELKFPAYLNKRNETIRDIGNMVVPEGTTISWDFSTRNASSLILSFDNTSPVSLNSENGDFNFTKKILKSSRYKINLVNPQATNTEAIDYSITVIPDLYPNLKVEEYKDSSLYSYVSLGGSISDDYGLERFRLFYRITDGKNKDKKFSTLAVPFNKNSNNQSFFYNWNIDSLKMNSGETLEYYLEVWDNDRVNGSKSSKSQMLSFKIPSEEEIEKEIATSSKNTETSIDKALSKSKSLNKEISSLQQKLKNKDNLSWQDKKNMEELLKKHEELSKELEKLKGQNEQLNKKEEKFNPSDPEMAYKLEQLQKLMDEMLDEETKKLYDDLRKLLEKQETNVDYQDILKKLENKDNNLEKELERTLEMFKEIKLEQKLDEAIKDLQELSQKQEQLADKTQKKQEDNQKLQEEQQQLKEDFKKVEEKLKEMKELNNSLENKKEVPETTQEQNEIQKEQNNSSENLQKSENKKSSSSQKNAAQKMKQMEQKLSQAQKNMQQKESKENIDDLRDILENLLTLSFDQEALMKDFRKVNQTDPRFVTLSQKQLKLKDDSKIIEDSLLALSKRVFQIQSFVTREVSKMNAAMDESIDAIKERRPDIATSKQQFAMTSINNLALLLSDALKQMQQQAASSSTPGSGSCKKPGNNKNPGNMGELQKALNQRISQLQKNGKGGQAYSEELAKLAAQQEMLRNALKELENKNGKNKGGKEGKNGEGGSMSELAKEMEKTETDLVNKRITPETIRRQQDILTRLLEAENATRERDTDEKRESKTAKQVTDKVPPSLEKYLKAKEKEVDLIKTISPSLMPYYKQEVNEYFQKIENKD